MNIVKSLEKKMKSKIDSVDSDPLVKESENLLLTGPSVERALLNNLGLATHIEAAEEMVNMKHTFQKYVEKFQTKVFHIDEIKEVCLKYRLIIKTTSNYAGPIPKDLSTILWNFFDKNGIAIPSGTGRGVNDGDFFIMAPPSMFKQKTTFTDVLASAVGSTQNTFENIVKSFQDPILLYRIDSDHFAFITEWGNDLNPIRRIKGFFTKTQSRMNFITVLATIAFLVGLFMVIPFGLMNDLAEHGDKGKTHPGYIFLFVVSVIGYAVATVGTIIYVRHIDWRNYATDRIWNKSGYY